MITDKQYKYEEKLQSIVRFLNNTSRESNDFILDLAKKIVIENDYILGILTYKAFIIKLLAHSYLNNLALDDINVEALALFTHYLKNRFIKKELTNYDKYNATYIDALLTIIDGIWNLIPHHVNKERGNDEYTILDECLRDKISIFNKKMMKIVLDSFKTCCGSKYRIIFEDKIGAIINTIHYQDDHESFNEKLLVEYISKRRNLKKEGLEWLKSLFNDSVIENSYIDLFIYYETFASYQNMKLAIDNVKLIIDAYKTKCEMDYEIDFNNVSDSDVVNCPDVFRVKLAYKIFLLSLNPISDLSWGKKIGKKNTLNYKFYSYIIQSSSFLNDVNIHKLTVFKESFDKKYENLFDKEIYTYFITRVNEDYCSLFEELYNVNDLSSAFNLTYNKLLSDIFKNDEVIKKNLSESNQILTMTIKKFKNNKNINPYVLVYLKEYQRQSSVK